VGAPCGSSTRGPKRGIDLFTPMESGRHRCNQCEGIKPSTAGTHGASTTAVETHRLEPSRVRSCEVVARLSKEVYPPAHGKQGYQQQGSSPRR
jgi:hypothetical protein